MNATIEIKRMAEVNGNEIIFGFYHQALGPCKNLMFILKNPNAEEIANLIFEYWKGVDPEKQMKMREEMKGKKPKNLFEIVLKCHLETFLAMVPVVFPQDLLDHPEFKEIPKVERIEDGIEKIANFLEVLSLIPIKSRQIALFS